MYSYISEINFVSSSQIIVPIDYKVIHIVTTVIFSVDETFMAS